MCATQTELLTLAIGVRVRRRGRRGDGPIAGLLRAVLISPGYGVVGGRSVLKKRFAVHHLTRCNVPPSQLVSFPPLNLILRQQKWWKPSSGYLDIVVRKAVWRWFTRSGDKNKEKTLRKNETSSLSMRQLCPWRRNNPKNEPLWRQEWSKSVW